MSDMTSDIHAESPDDTLARWRDWQSMTCGANSVRQRADILERLREHAATRSGRMLDDVDPRTLTAEDVSSYMAAKPGWSANTRSTYFRHLRSWFDFLHQTGRTPTNPVAALRRPRARQGVPSPLTEREVAAVFAGVHQDLWAMMALALYAGLRAHEVAMFRAEQIRGQYLVVLGKGEKPARLPLATQLADLAYRMPGDGWWFPSSLSGTGHVTEDSISKRVAARFREVGVPTGSIHRLRHTYGTLVHRAHRDLLVTQRLLRHASVATTMIYAAVEDDDMASALTGLPLLSA